MGIQINGLTDIISASDGSLTVSGADLSNLTQLNVTGVATFQGNVSIAGTLTYDDVTNVDSLGIVTARKGIRITNNTAAGAAGTISSPADNVLAFGTNDVERVRIDSSGNVGVGTNNPNTRFEILGSSTTLRITGDSSSVARLDLSSAAAVKWSLLSNPAGSSAAFTILKDDIEQFRITSIGNVGIGSTQISSKLDVAGNVKVIGVVTATSFSGSGANLTGLPAGFSELDGMLFG